MTPDRHSRRFDPRWLIHVIGTDGGDLCGTPEASPRSAAEESMYDPVRGQFDEALAEFDEALEQFVTDGCRVCPVCGLRFLMDQQGLTLGETANGAGIAESAFSEMLGGRRKMAARHIRGLAKLFGVSANVIIRDTE